MRIRFTPSARAQLLAAAAYIYAERPAAARHFRIQLEAALLRLVDFPESGRMIPEFERLGFREVLVGSYRVFYRVQGDVIWVVGVWHDSQLPDEPQAPAEV